MSKEEIIVGLDVGSNNIRTVIGKVTGPESKLHIVGVGEAESGGIRKGVIVDVEEAVSSISASLEKAERTGGCPVESAFVSVSGSHIITQNSKGVIAVSRADNEITEDDVARVVEASSAISIPTNHEILHVVPKTFKVDDQEGIKDPLGMNGIRLEAEVMIVEGSTSFVRNLSKCISRAGVEINDMIVSPMAAAESIMSKKQKELGSVLIDIGSGTTGVCAFEEGEMIYTAILPVGSEHITNDIAIGLRTSVDIAEKIKLEYGSALAREIGSKEIIELADFGGEEKDVVLRKHVAEIIEARLAEIFSMVDKELKKVDRAGKLPGGAIITGGGAKLPNLVDLAKKELNLPVQIGFPMTLPGLSDKMDDPAFATAEGLLLWGMNHAGEGGNYVSGAAIGDTVGKVKKWFKTFLP